MRKKVAVLLLTYDGVTSWYCGLGSITQYFIHSMPEAVRILKKEGREVSFFIGLPFTTKGCLGYRKDLLPKTKKIIRKLGGDIIYFSDNSDGISQYGSLENWQSASNGAASVVINIVEKFDQVIVYSFDTPYCAVGRNVSKQLSHYNGNMPEIIWVPHSTGLIHETKGIKHSRERFAWEKSAVDDSKIYDNCSVGFINNFMKNHLIDRFGASEEKLVPLINGVVKKNQKRCKLPKWFSSDDIVFSTGRAESYKGFDYLIRAFAASQKQHNAMLLLLVSISTACAPIYDKLEKLMKKLKVRGKIINDFISLEELGEIFKQKNVKIISVPSIGEPFGLIPEEVRINSRVDGPLLLLSNTDGLSEQIVNNKDGFLIDVTNTKKFSNKITKILSLDRKQCQAITKEGKKHLKKDYYYPNNIIESIRKILESK